MIAEAVGGDGLDAEVVGGDVLVAFRVVGDILVVLFAEEGVETSFGLGVEVVEALEAFFGLAGGLLILALPPPLPP